MPNMVVELRGKRFRNGHRVFAQGDAGLSVGSGDRRCLQCGDLSQRLGIKQ